MTSVGVPKYIAVRDNLRKRIDVMQPGERLPSEAELCTQYNVSRITLRHAIESLKNEGLLIREQGRGTFRSRNVVLSENHGVISDKVEGFFHQGEKMGQTARAEVLLNEVVQDDDAADMLGLPHNAELICLKRLCYVGEVLSHYSVSYMQAARFPKVLTHDFTSGSLSSFLLQTYPVQFFENNLTVRLDRICESTSSILQLACDTPVLTTQSLVKDMIAVPIVLTACIYTPAGGELNFCLHARSM